MKNRLISILLVICMVVSMVPAMLPHVSATTNNKTSSEAVSWAQNHAANKSILDYDGAYGAQCVDLIKYYYVFLGNSAVTGNGKDYATNSLPAGWERIQYYSGFVPQPGDVAVWTTGGGGYGHVAIITSANASTMSVVEQNWAGKYCSSRSGVSTSGIWGVIRPDFPDYAYADLGDDFFGVILNTACWKPISVDSDNYVRLRTEAGTSNQLWYFDRQNDGSYVISSAYNGRALEMYYGDTTSGNPVAVAEYWGGYYQQWYFIKQGNGYVIQSKHYPELNLVLDLPNNNSADGTTITTYTRNNTDAQIWTVYSANDVQLKAPTLSVSVGNSATNTVFTWNEIYGETEYDVKIWKGTLWEGDAYHIKWNTKSGYAITLPAGTYHAYVDAANYYNTKMSNVVTFTVANKTYTVSYNANGGSGAPSSQTKTHGVNLTLSSTVPTRTGYTFLGWSTSSTATSATYQPGATFSANANTTLYAVWKANTYTVSYNANGGTGAPSAQTKTHGVNLTLSSTVPTRTGYTFLGWSTSSTATSATYQPGATFTTNTNTTLYAVWKANTYTVSYNANGGTGAPSAQTKTHGVNMTLSSTVPTRSGYSFLGWSTSSTATSATYQPGATFTTNANTTLYAVWKANTYTVSYNANGGSGAPSSQNKTHGVNLTLSSTVPTRSGYSFLGWSTSSSATSATYQPGATFTTNANTTLYAVWKEDIVLLNGWVEENGSWYYYQNGQKVTGWLKSGNYWYYLDADGVMTTGWVKVGSNWFYMNQNGVMMTGWVKDNGKWYYMASGGAMQTGWITVGDSRYYLDSKGVMQTGWIQLDDTWYYLTSSGKIATGWTNDGSYWYYMDENGMMQRGWITVNGKWYYMNKSGVMVTGWLKDGGYWYYLGSDGAMLTGTHTINGKTYVFNKNGVWIG